jgi:hypothetical protein
MEAGMRTPFQQAVAALDRRLDDREPLSECDVWSLLAFSKTELVRLQVSRLLGRIRRAERQPVGGEDHNQRDLMTATRRSNGSAIYRRDVV